MEQAFEEGPDNLEVAEMDKGDKMRLPFMHFACCAGSAEADLEASGADAAEADAEDSSQAIEEGPDDFEAAEMDEEEDEVQHLGSQGFSPAELAAAQAALGLPAQARHTCIVAELGSIKIWWITLKSRMWPLRQQPWQGHSPCCSPAKLSAAQAALGLPAQALACERADVVRMLPLQHAPVGF